MLDPLLFRLISFLMALLFGLAAMHKLNDATGFRGILAAYDVLPSAWVSPIAFAIPMLEIALGFAWLFAWRPELISLASVLLLSSYVLAIGINLLRGRSYIDCGCSFSSVNASGDDNSVQQLSVWLIYRNLLLIGLAYSAGLEVGTRSIGTLDYFSLVAALLALAFVYAAFNQLLINHNAIDSWRTPLIAGEGNDSE